MSIDSDLQPVASITEGDRALDLFTDRYSFTRLLAERLNDPPQQEILFFHGAGGNGKSLLLKYLRTKICRRLTAAQWQQAKEKPDDELAKALENLEATECLPVPTALLDFAPGSSGSKGRDSDPFYGLVRIRDELAASTVGTPYRLKFPLHTYGCFLYLQKTNRLSEVDSLFPFEEAGLIKDFVELFQPLPGVGIGLSVLGLVDKYSGDRLTHYKRRFSLDDAEVNRLQGMDAEAELILELPRLLAQDLNVAMAADKQDTPERIVLFFDTHEAFYGESRSHSKNFFRDSWLRRLLRRLETEAGIVVIVSGRDKPRWAEADRYELHTQIPADYVCLKSVDDLAESDAEIFLIRAGVEDVALRESLIRYASVEAGRVHPLHLGLCADVVLEAAAKGVALVPGDFSEVAAFREKSAYLIEQLLKWVDEGLRDAIRALSACRAFDFEIYRLLGETLSFAVDRATFRRLVGFSFVRQVAQRGNEWFRIHDLLRRLGDEPAMVRAHEVLAAYYEQREVEWIYHVNQLDWSQGVDLWANVFDEALEVSRYELCRSLLDLRRELTIRTPFKLGCLSVSEGKYYQNLALYGAAKRKYGEAIAAYNEDLTIDSNSVAALNNKGLSLLNLADLQLALSEHSAAKENYEASIVAYNAALELDPSLVQALNGKGNSLRQLANLQVKLSEHSGARDSYEASIAIYDVVLELAPSDVSALNNKGLLLSNLADLQSKISRYSAAKDSYEASIAAYNAALELAPSSAQVLNNKGSSLQQLANLQVKLSEHSGARDSYEASIAIYDVVLELAPSDVSALNNKGLLLSNLADLQSKLSRYSAAKDSYEASIAAYNAALELAPSSVQVLNNKALSLQQLASLQAMLSEYGAARDSCEASVAIYDVVLELAPDDVSVLNNKGNALQKLADFQSALSEHGEARAIYEATIATYDEALALDPDSVQELDSLGLLQNLADLQSILPERGAARTSYEASIAAYDAVLELAPNDMSALDNKGLSLQSLSDLLMQQEQLELAINCYKRALLSWERSLQIAPDNSRTQQRRDHLVSFMESLLDNFRSAITDQLVTVQQTPDDIEALMSRVYALGLLAKLQVALSQTDGALESYISIVSLYQTAITINPSNWQHHFSIGDIRLQSASLLDSAQPAKSDAYRRQALEDWNQAIELNPDNAELQELRDWLLTELQNNGLA